MIAKKLTKLVLAALTVAPITGGPARRNGGRHGAGAQGGSGKVVACADGCQPRNAKIHRSAAQSSMARPLEDRGGMAQSSR